MPYKDKGKQREANRIDRPTEFSEVYDKRDFMSLREHIPTRLRIFIPAKQQEPQSSD